MSQQDHMNWPTPPMKPVPPVVRDKFCIDCIYHVSEDDGQHNCIREKDLVTGEVIENRECENRRKTDAYCGPNAKHFIRVKKPKGPIGSLIKDGDRREKCNECGSSLKRKFFGGVIGCLHPECKNYWRKPVLDNR